MEKHMFKNVEFGFTDGGTPTLYFKNKTTKEERDFIIRWLEWRSRTSEVTRQILFEE